jgi:hypothetical protein
MGRPAIDLTGKRLGRWSVLGRCKVAKSGAGKHARWICRCECGTQRTVNSAMLLQGQSASCGCLQAEQVTARNTTHGMYGTTLYWNVYGSEKRAKKLFALPPWTDYYEIKRIYQNRPPGHHVDHIIPLVHSKVCGLHCPANLQYLPAAVNCSKKNHFITDWDTP